MKFKVASKACQRCLLTDAKLVSDEQRDRILKATPDDEYLTCQTALLKDRHSDDRKTCCWSYYSQGASQLVRAVKQLETSRPGLVEWVKL